MREPRATTPFAESPISPPDPLRVEQGWRVGGRPSRAPLRIADATPLAKVLVRGDQGSLATALGVPFGQAARLPDGVLVAGTGPGRWLLLGAPGSAASLIALGTGAADPGDPGLVTVVDRTHALALVRLSGAAAPDLLGRVCPVDLHPAVTPDGAVLTSLVAGMTVGIIRDDRAAVRSYLLSVDRSLGRALFEALLDAGGGFGVAVDGFRTPS